MPLTVRDNQLFDHPKLHRRLAVLRYRSSLGGMPLSGEYAPSPWDWSRENAEQYMSSGGTEGTEMKGKPVVLLTTVGAKTGKLRKTPLMRVEHNGQYAIVASLGGAPKHPVWYHNVVKNPRVELQDGTVTGDYDAREVFGDEKAQWWERAVAAWPDYADYQQKTDREIPVFVLTPVG
ncbi:F420H(2)-dependent quinone reductase [Mycolicibacter algericus]|uniref:F420H(2)-dependent quinone reductase n=2 Tax=Mycolicibacter algericus TaxID=1288388 RepID=A0A7I9Y924_MYCAL|nr:F420H(2)-dependent quinone reductase [Mycolicibacter algericus]